MLNDGRTIAAVSTPRGLGALGIVRLSGAETESVLRSCFHMSEPRELESHRAYYGAWKHPQSGETLDQVVVIYFGEGRGYTGERAADVMCHGSAITTETILQTLIDSGARLAQPGEFTYRAFMNGRLDLPQAESVLDLVHAKSPRAAARALANLTGGLSKALVQIESQMIFVLANLEASIDFTTEDIQPVNFSEMGLILKELQQELSTLSKSFFRSQTVEQGLLVALVGKPNAGKSSLLNTLLGTRRSIVSENPGTTRDVVEAEMLIEGQLVRFFDTAGLRDTTDPVEKEGVERAHGATSQAHLIFYVVDALTGLDKEDLSAIDRFGAERTVLCFNKSDLCSLAESLVRSREQAGIKISEKFKFISSNTLSLSGVDQMRAVLAEKIRIEGDGEVSGVVSTVRQNELVQGATAALGRATELCMKGASPDVISLELRVALEGVQEILGKRAGDDVMDRVFKEFCIGK